MISAIFERFVEMTPITVMVRAIMERIFAPAALDQLFEDTAEQQYQRELLFSTWCGIAVHNCLPFTPNFRPV
jgi:hypothetical protein